jgi:hypothetical protein
LRIGVNLDRSHPSPLHELAERGEPLRKTLLLEMIGPVVVLVGGTVECRPLLDEGLVAFDDGHDPDRRRVVSDGKGWRCDFSLVPFWDFL